MRERELDSRRVPSPNLEPVDAVEQEVDPGVFDEALRGELLDAVGAGQVQDLFDVGEDVLLEAPEDVLQEDETAVDDLHLRRGKASGFGLEQALLPGQKCRHLGNEGLKGRCLGGIEEKGLEMGFLPQEHEVPLHLLERANACEVPFGLDLSRDHPRERGLADCGEMLCEVGAGVDCKGLRTFLDGQDAGDAAAQERGVHREEDDREGRGLTGVAAEKEMPLKEKRDEPFHGYCDHDSLSDPVDPGVHPVPVSGNVPSPRSGSPQGLRLTSERREGRPGRGIRQHPQQTVTRPNRHPQIPGPVPG